MEVLMTIYLLAKRRRRRLSARESIKLEKLLNNACIDVGILETFAEHFYTPGRLIIGMRAGKTR